MSADAERVTVDHGDDCCLDSHIYDKSLPSQDSGIAGIGSAADCGKEEDSSSEQQVANFATGCLKVGRC